MYIVGHQWRTWLWREFDGEIKVAKFFAATFDPVRFSVLTVITNHRVLHGVHQMRLDAAVAREGPILSVSVGVFVAFSLFGHEAFGQCGLVRRVYGICVSAVGLEVGLDAAFGVDLAGAASATKLACKETYQSK